MTVSVNGEPRELPAGASVSAVLDVLDLEPRRRGIAVAVDGEVIPRAEWGAFPVTDGARVEVLNAIQGG